MLIVIEILGLLFLAGSIKTIKSIYRDSPESPKEKPFDPSSDKKSGRDSSEAQK